MGLFGGNRGRPDLGRVLTGLVQGTNGLDRMDARRQAEREAMRAEQEAEQTRFMEDRIRAQLSPADGPAGSGTGAMPTIEQQMATLDEAQLLNPAVAAQFAPVVQRRQMAGLMGGRPANEQLAAMMNPEQAGQSYASQFRDETLSAGSIRSRGGQAMIGAPVVNRYDDRPGVTDPVTGQTVYGEPRGPTYAEMTQRRLGEGNLGVAQDRLEMDRDNSGFTLAPNQTRFDNQGNPVANVAPPRASNEAQASSALNAISNTREAITRARGQTGFWTTGPLSALPLNTPARDLNATLDTVKANLSFNELAQMRANSPTGGALGSIAVRELDLLGSTVASLDQSQSREELERSLSIIEQSLARWEETVRAGQGQQTPQGQQAQSGPIAVNPNTGERVQWNGSAWVPVR